MATRLGAHNIIEAVQCWIAHARRFHTVTAVASPQEIITGVRSKKITTSRLPVALVRHKTHRLIRVDVSVIVCLAEVVFQLAILVRADELVRLALAQHAIGTARLERAIVHCVHGFVGGFAENRRIALKGLQKTLVVEADELVILVFAQTAIAAGRLGHAFIR